MIVSVFLVISIALAGAPPRERHRIAVADAAECVRQGQSIAAQATVDMKPGTKIILACEFTRL